MIFKTSLVPFALLLINPALSVNEGLKAYYQDVGTYGNPTSEAPSTTQAENNSMNNVLQGDDNKDAKAPPPMPVSLPIGESQVKEVEPKTGKQLDPDSNPQNDAQSKKNTSANPTNINISKDAISKAIDEIAKPQSNSAVNPITALNAKIVADNAQQIPDAIKTEQSDPSLQQASQLVASQSKDGADANKLQQDLQSAIQNNPQNQQAIDSMAYLLINGDEKGYDKLKSTTLDKFETDPQTANMMKKNLFRFFQETGSNELFANVVQNLAQTDSNFGNQLLSSMFANTFITSLESDQQQGSIPQPQQGDQPQIPASPPPNPPSTSHDQNQASIPDNIPKPLPDQSKESPLVPSIGNIPNIPAPPNNNSAQDSKSDSANKPPNSNSAQDPKSDNASKPPSSNSAQDSKSDNANKPSSQDQVPETNSPLENNGGTSEGLPPPDKGLMDMLKGGPPTDEAGVQKMMKALEDAQKKSNPSSNADSKPKFFSDSGNSSNNLSDSQSQQPVTIPQQTQTPSPQEGFQSQRFQAQNQQASAFNGQQFQGAINNNQFAIPLSFQAQPQYYQPQYQGFIQSPYYGY